MSVKNLLAQLSYYKECVMPDEKDIPIQIAGHSGSYEEKKALSDLIMEKVVTPFYQGVHGEASLDPDEKIRRLNHVNSRAWDGAMLLLMNQALFPNEKINKLAQLGWKLIEHRVTPVVASDAMALAGLHILMVGKTEQDVKCGIYMPMNWYGMICSDPVFQMGAIVFILSQCVDYWHKKFMDQESMLSRAYAYEAEYLLVARTMNPQIELNGYQKKVLDNYPKGLASLDPKHAYEMREWSA
jgi:hypothetical protein